MTISLIRAQEEHLDLVALLFDGYRQFYRKESNLAGARSFIQERLQKADSIIYLALDEAQTPLGFTQLYPCFSSVRMRRIWILNDLFVAPEARQLGVGRLLMNRAKQLGAETDAIALSLATEKDNSKAKSLYESLGYEQDTSFDYYELTL